MSLINCRECKKEISNQAEFCPHCGNSIKPVLTERTSKHWKLVKLISWIFIIFGLYLFLYNLQRGGFSNPLTGLGFTITFFSFIALIVAKFGAWWNHD